MNKCYLFQGDKPWSAIKIQLLDYKELEELFYTYNILSNTSIYRINYIILHDLLYAFHILTPKTYGPYTKCNETLLKQNRQKSN